jgi:nucleotide-binding universal stress UspA family protein
MATTMLICTNGYAGTWPCIEYGAWAAGAIEAPVSLLGITEEGANRAALDDLLGRAEALLGERGLRYSVEKQSGKAEQLIPLAARRAESITVLGPLGRPRLRRLLVGRSIRTLLEEIPTAILYVPHVCLPLKRMLVCLGGLGYEMTAEHLAVRLGVAAGARATLLHVAPPVDLNYPTARAEGDLWRDLVHTDTLPGRNLRRALDAAVASGLTATIKMRQGIVVEEILAEIRSGSYDLICMGSPQSGRVLRHLYEPNVTDEIAEQAPCPVLTARYVPERTGDVRKNTA